MSDDEQALSGVVLAQVSPCLLHPRRHCRQRFALAWGVLHGVGEALARIVGHALHHLAIGQSLPCAVLGLAPCSVFDEGNVARTTNGLSGGVGAAQAGVQDRIDLFDREEAGQCFGLALPIGCERAIGVAHIAPQEIPIGLPMPHQPNATRDARLKMRIHAAIVLGISIASLRLLNDLGQSHGRDSMGDWL